MSKSNQLFLGLISLFSLLALPSIASPDVTSEEEWKWNKITDTEPLKELMIEHSELKDPFSVRFRKTFQMDIQERSITVWCGELNSKNSMGAYVGWGRFYAMWAPKKREGLSLGIEGENERFELEEVNTIMFQTLFDTYCKDLPN